MLFIILEFLVILIFVKSALKSCVYMYSDKGDDTNLKDIMDALIAVRFFLII